MTRRIAGKLVKAKGRSPAKRLGMPRMPGEDDFRTLADLKPGESGVVDSVGGEGALHRHLLDMGITPGVTILLQKVAPMGDPLELHLRGYALTLRREDAQKIRLVREFIPRRPSPMTG